MYKTQMEAAKKGILTKEMKSIAKSESMDEKLLIKGYKGRRFFRCGKKTCRRWSGLCYYSCRIK